MKCGACCFIFGSARYDIDCSLSGRVIVQEQKDQRKAVVVVVVVNDPLTHQVMFAVVRRLGATSTAANASTASSQTT